jgi:hypothetical protein
MDLVHPEIYEWGGTKLNLSSSFKGAAPWAGEEVASPSDDAAGAAARSSKRAKRAVRPGTAGLQGKVATAQVCVHIYISISSGRI